MPTDDETHRIQQQTPVSIIKDINNSVEVDVLSVVGTK
jgi:hypothetical protein